MRFKDVVRILIVLWTTTLCFFVIESLFQLFAEIVGAQGGEAVTLQHPTGQDIPIYERVDDTNEFIPMGTVVPSGRECRAYNPVEDFVYIKCKFGARKSNVCGTGGTICGYVNDNWVEFSGLKGVYIFLFRISIIFTLLLPILFWVWKKRTNAAANSIQNETPPT